jgi:hypothetical protein
MPAMPRAGSRAPVRLGRAAAVPALVIALVLAIGPAGMGMPSATAAGEGVGVSGTLLTRDGAPFLPRGFNLIGLLTPAWCTRATGVAARTHYGQAELDAARAWGANTLRFQVSQRGLADPSVPAADRQAYLQLVRDGVALARSAGFVVIVSMQDQFYGCGEVHPMPSQQTLDAWSALAPALMADPDVLFELFNEPRNEADTAGWAQWRDGGSSPDANLGDPAVGHQRLVDHLRNLGSSNVLVADAARLGERTTGMPRLADPLGRIAYGIHPYNYTSGPTWWDRHYGDAAAEVPVIATEWNHLADGCGTAKERLAPDLLVYLRQHSIGVLAHAFDVPRTTIADWTWAPTACGTGAGGSGRVLQTFFAGLAGQDIVPPTVPAGLAAPTVTGDEVELAWTASTDASGTAEYVVLRDGAVVGRTTTPGWTDTAVGPQRSYSYQVRAVDTAGNVSGNSAPLAVTTPAPPPDTSPPTAPGGLTVRILSPTEVQLRWQAARDDRAVTGYRVTRDGTVLTSVTGLTTTDSRATDGPHTYGVTAFDAANNASPPAEITVTVPAAAPRGLTGSYFDTSTFSTQRVVRIDATVDFGWGTGRPAATVGADTFSVRWTGRLLVPAAGSYTFTVQSDDAARLWIDGRLVVDDWTPHALREARGAVTLTVDRAHDVRLDYLERTRSATVRLQWAGPGLSRQTVPAAQLLAR